MTPSVFQCVAIDSHVLYHMILVETVTLTTSTLEIEEACLIMRRIIAWHLLMYRTYGGK